MSVPGFVEFEFDLPEALLSSLVKVFDAMTESPLLPENVNEIPEAQGVYQLTRNGHVVYIGKTDGQSGLKQRLLRHAYSIQDRSNLDPEHVHFKAVRLYVFTAMDLETQLIDHYGKPDWNFSGFGSNDPGRNRDNTKLKPLGFDAQFPINIDRELDVAWPSDAKAAQVLQSLKKELPYLIRFELKAGGRRAHAELEAADIVLPVAPRTVRTILEAVIRTLPSGWQATLLPSRVLVYRENVDYTHGTVIARS